MPEQAPRRTLITRVAKAIAVEGVIISAAVVTWTSIVHGFQGGVRVIEQAYNDAGPLVLPALCILAFGMGVIFGLSDWLERTRRSLDTASIGAMALAPPLLVIAVFLGHAPSALFSLIAIGVGSLVFALGLTVFRPWQSRKSA